MLESGRVQRDDEHNMWLQELTGEVQSFETGDYLLEEDLEMGMLNGEW